MSLVDTMSIAAFADTLTDETFVLDVRTTDEFAAGHVPGAVNIPLAILPVRHHELPTGTTIHVICDVGARSYQAARFLAGAGHPSVSIDGGIAGWITAGKAVER